MKFGIFNEVCEERTLIREEGWRAELWLSLEKNN
jgi:hypothetical protein